jgi:hypothetical protein
MERREVKNKNEADESQEERKEGDSKLKAWLKKLGVAGFLFFLIKGIIWLLVFFGLFELVSC